MEKLMKISKNLNIFVNVARQIFKAAAVVIAVCVVILLFVSPQHEMWRNGTYTLELGHVTLELIPDGAIPVEATRNRVIGGLIFCVPLLLIMARCLGVVQNILQPMSQGRPFDRRVSDSFRKLSFYVLIGGFLAEAARMLTAALQLNSLKLSALFNPALVSGSTVEIVMDTGFLFLFSALYLMSHVFRYGEQLQQLSDETL